MTHVLPPSERTPLEADLERGDKARIRDRLPYLAWRWYQIPQQVAEDLVQAALLTYLEVRSRYPQPEEHPRIIVGIFRNKCREHIDREVRMERKRRALLDAGEAGTTGCAAVVANATPEDGVLDELVRREDFHLILQALSELRPSAREMFRLIIEDGASRQQLIAHYGLNKNTLDSRLHTYRKELRAILARRGF